MIEAAPSMRERVTSWLNDRPDDHILRWLFGAMVTATIAVAVMDYVEMAQAPERQAMVTPSSPGAPSTSKPSAEPLPSTTRQGDKDRRGPLRTSDKRLAQPMTFELMGDGRLIATGSIMPGAADAFAAEIGKRGAYVKTVVLHSPGGSVQDALTIGRLIREKKFNTAVDAGSYCASSCPLVFAAGVEREAGAKASIGVHQVFAVAQGPGNGQGSGGTIADGMDNAQRVSAQCQTYLRDMGVDQQVWVHAMQTPKDELFYFKPDEMLTLKLATSANGGKTPPAAARAGL